MEDRRKQMRTELKYQIDRLSGFVREKSNIVSQTWRVGNQH